MKRVRVIKCLFFAVMWFFCTITYAISITIGTTSNNPPLASQADTKNHFFGFEIDIMNALCTRLSLTCAYLPIQIGQLLSYFQSGSIDIALAQVIRPSRPVPGFVFSLPYLKAGGRLMTLASSSINTPKDLVNKTIGVRLGTFGQQTVFQYYLLNLYQNQVKIKGYYLQNDLMGALSNNQVDAVFSVSVILDYWNNNNSGLYKPIGGIYDIPGNGYGIMATDKYTDLMNQINAELLKMRADGTYDTIYNRYFQTFQ